MLQWGFSYRRKAEKLAIYLFPCDGFMVSASRLLITVQRDLYCLSPPLHPLTPILAPSLFLYNRTDFISWFYDFKAPKFLLCCPRRFDPYWRVFLGPYFGANKRHICYRVHREATLFSSFLFLRWFPLLSEAS